MSENIDRKSDFSDSIRRVLLPKIEKGYFSTVFFDSIRNGLRSGEIYVRFFLNTLHAVTICKINVHDYILNVSKYILSSFNHALKGCRITYKNILVQAFYKLRLHETYYFQY